MRIYEYKKEMANLLTPEVVALLTQIHEHKGVQGGAFGDKPEILASLVQVAKIQSAEASNKIEGIFTSSGRLKMLVEEKTTPKSRAEEEIAGYRDVLATIHEAYQYIPLSSSVILQLHRDLYAHNGVLIGGSYKNANNIIAEETPQGDKRVRFTPVDAWETPYAIENLTRCYNEAIADATVNPLVVMAMFVLDFLCIHPFNDGNGRMSRLLTLLLLYRAEYFVGKYISIEKIIEKTKIEYYDALWQSSQGWHENTNDYLPFVKYMLGVILHAYKELGVHARIVDGGLSKPQRIENLIKETLGKISKSEIMQKNPDISQTTVQRTLSALLKSGKIHKIGSNKFAVYIWNRGV